MSFNGSKKILDPKSSTSVRLIIYRAVVSAFEPFCPVDTVLLFIVLLYYICVDK